MQIVAAGNYYGWSPEEETKMLHEFIAAAKPESPFKKFIKKIWRSIKETPFGLSKSEIDDKYRDMWIKLVEYGKYRNIDPSFTLSHFIMFKEKMEEKINKKSWYYRLHKALKNFFAKKEVDDKYEYMWAEFAKYGKYANLTPEQTLKRFEIFKQARIEEEKKTNKSITKYAKDYVGRRLVAHVKKPLIGLSANDVREKYPALEPSLISKYLEAGYNQEEALDKADEDIENIAKRSQKKSYWGRFKRWARDQLVEMAEDLIGTTKGYIDDKYEKVWPRLLAYGLSQGKPFELIQQEFELMKASEFHKKRDKSLLGEFQNMFRREITGYSKEDVAERNREKFQEIMARVGEGEGKVSFETALMEWDAFVQLELNRLNRKHKALFTTVKQAARVGVKKLIGNTRGDIEAKYQDEYQRIMSRVPYDIDMSTALMEWDTFIEGKMNSDPSRKKAVLRRAWKSIKETAIEIWNKNQSTPEERLAQLNKAAKEQEDLLGDVPLDKPASSLERLKRKFSPEEYDKIAKMVEEKEEKLFTTVQKMLKNYDPERSSINIDELRRAILEKMDDMHKQISEVLPVEALSDYNTLHKKHKDQIVDIFMGVALDQEVTPEMFRDAFKEVADDWALELMQQKAAKINKSKKEEKSEYQEYLIETGKPTTSSEAIKKAVEDKKEEQKEESISDKPARIAATEKEESKPTTSSEAIKNAKIEPEEESQVVITEHGPLEYIKSAQDKSFNPAPTKDNAITQAKIEHDKELKERQTEATERIADALTGKNDDKTENNEKKSWLDSILGFLKHPFQLLKTILHAPFALLTSLGSAATKIAPTIVKIGKPILNMVNMFGGLVWKFGERLGGLLGGIGQILLRHKKIATIIGSLGYVGNWIYNKFFADEGHTMLGDITDWTAEKVSAGLDATISTLEKGVNAISNNTKPIIDTTQEGMAALASHGAVTMVGGSVGSGFAKHFGKSGTLGGGLGATLASQAYNFYQTGQIDSASDIAQDLAINTGMTYIANRFWGSKPSPATTEAGAQTAAKAAENSSKAKAIVETVNSKFTTLEQTITKHFPKIADGVRAFLGQVYKYITNSQTLAKISSKLGMTAIVGTATGGIGLLVLQSAFALKAFYDGWTQAPEIFHKNPIDVSMGEKIISGVICAVTQLIPVIGPFLPATDMLKWAIDTIGPYVGYVKEKGTIAYEKGSEVYDKQAEQNRERIAKFNQQGSQPNALTEGYRSAIDTINKLAFEQEKQTRILILEQSIKTNILEIAADIQSLVSFEFHKSLSLFAYKLSKEIIKDPNMVQSGFEKYAKSRPGSTEADLLHMRVNHETIRQQFTFGCTTTETYLGIKHTDSTSAMRSFSGFMHVLFFALPYLTCFLSETKIIDMGIDTIGRSIGFRKEDLAKFKAHTEKRAKKDIQASIQNSNINAIASGEAPSTNAIQNTNTITNAQQQATEPKQQKETKQETKEEDKGVWDTITDKASSAWDSIKEFFFGKARELENNQYGTAKKKEKPKTFYNQHDKEFKTLIFNSKSDDTKQTFETAGCGPATVLNAIRDQGITKGTPEEAMKHIIRTGNKEKNGGTMPAGLSSYARKVGADVETIHSKDKALKAHQEGKTLMVMGQGGPYGKGVHWMTLKANGKVADSDPSQNSSGTGSNMSYNQKDLLNKATQIIAVDNRKQKYRYGTSNADSSSSGFDDKHGLMGALGSVASAFTGFITGMLTSSSPKSNNTSTAQIINIADLPFGNIAIEAAKKIGSAHPEFFWAQMMHETGGPDYIASHNNEWVYDAHNYFGYKWTPDLGEERKSDIYCPASESGGARPYAKFKDDEDAANMWYERCLRYYPGLKDAQTPEEYAHALKHRDDGAEYYEDTESNYAAGLRTHLENPKYKNKLKNLTKAGMSRYGTSRFGKLRHGGFADGIYSLSADGSIQGNASNVKSFIGKYAQEAMGLSTQATAALMGTAEQESAYSPVMMQGGFGTNEHDVFLENNEMPPTQPDQAWGLLQMTNARQKAMVEHARSNQRDPNSVEAQLRYLYDETTTGSEKGKWQALRDAKDVNEAMSAMQQIIRFGVSGKRNSAAQKAFQELGGQPTESKDPTFSASINMGITTSSSSPQYSTKVGAFIGVLKQVYDKLASVLSWGNKTSSSSFISGTAPGYKDINKAIAWAEERCKLKDTHYGYNGCTEFVKNFLKEGGCSFGDWMETNSPPGGCPNVYDRGSNVQSMMYVPCLEEYAKQNGLFKDPSVGGALGDIIICNNSSHVGICDGQGGCWANSSSQDCIIHWPSNAQAWGNTIVGYISVGGGQSVASTLKEGETARDEETIANDSGGKARYGTSRNQHLDSRFFDDTPQISNRFTIDNKYGMANEEEPSNVIEQTTLEANPTSNFNEVEIDKAIERIEKFTENQLKTIYELVDESKLQSPSLKIDWEKDPLSVKRQKLQTIYKYERNAIGPPKQKDSKNVPASSSASSFSSGLLAMTDRITSVFSKIKEKAMNKLKEVIGNIHPNIKQFLTDVFGGTHVFTDILGISSDSVPTQTTTSTNVIQQSTEQNESDNIEQQEQQLTMNDYLAQGYDMESTLEAMYQNQSGRKRSNLYGMAKTLEDKEWSEQIKDISDGTKDIPKLKESFDTTSSNTFGITDKDLKYSKLGMVKPNRYGTGVPILMIATQLAPYIARILIAVGRRFISSPTTLKRFIQWCNSADFALKVVNCITKLNKVIDVGLTVWDICDICTWFYKAYNEEATHTNLPPIPVVPFYDYVEAYLNENVPIVNQITTTVGGMIKQGVQTVKRGVNYVKNKVSSWFGYGKQPRYGTERQFDFKIFTPYIPKEDSERINKPNLDLKYYLAQGYNIDAALEQMYQDSRNPDYADTQDNSIKQRDNIEEVAKISNTRIEKLQNNNEEIVEEIAPNGKHYTKNDVDHLLNKGYSRESALEFLSRHEKYAKKKPQEIQQTTITNPIMTTPIPKQVTTEAQDKAIKLAEEMLIAQNRTNELLENILIAIQGLSDQSTTTQNISRAALTKAGNGSSVGIGDQLGYSGDRSKGNPINLINSMLAITHR